MPYLNYRKNNPLYSPGLSTYTVKGEQGERGNDGFSIYYTDSVIHRNESALNRVNVNIISGTMLSSDSTPADDRIAYKANDLVIDGCGDVYIIIEKDGVLGISDTNDSEYNTRSGRIGSIRQGIIKPFYTYIKEEDGIEYISIDSDLRDVYRAFVMDKDMNYIKNIDPEVGEISVSNDMTYVQIIEPTSGEMSVFNIRG